MKTRPKILAVITARGGSKRIPRKNVKELGGKPLIAWTIEAAQKSEFISRLILSSEDAEIISVAKNFGCEVPFVRSAKLSEDSTKSIDVILDVLTKIPEYDYLLLLQPTSPFRTTQDIDDFIRWVLEKKYDSAVSVNSKTQQLNGALYLNKFAFLLEHKTFVTDATLKFPMREDHSLDLDTPDDWSRAEELFKNRVP